MEKIWKKYLNIIIIVSIVFSIYLVIGSVNATIYVSPSGNDSGGDGSENNPYQSIGYAVNKSTANDNIILKNGVYNKSSDNNITINKNIRIQGNQSKTIIDTQNPLNTPIFTINASCSLILENITLKNINNIFSGRSPIVNNGKLTVENCNFTNNKVTGSATVISNNGILVGLNCNFTNNTGTYCGAIDNGAGKSIELTNCNFINNIGGSFGAAIYNDGGSGTITSCSFINNDAVQGGAIFIGPVAGSSLSFKLCDFTDNKGILYGGAIVKYDGNITLNDCNFTNNRVNNSNSIGGALLNNKGQCNISNCIFKDNKAVKAAGAIYNAGNSNITNCSFIRNNAASGGGIYAENRTLIESSNFENNTANDGGAIYFDNTISNYNGTLIYSRIVNNTGTDIYVDGNLGNVNADYNWWGTNTPTNMINIVIDSFYVVNAIAVKNTGFVGENWTINYTFYLNGTNDSKEYWKLPLFMAELLNTTSKVDDRIAYYTGNWNIPIVIATTETFNIVLDNEIIPLGTFTSNESSNTSLNMDITGDSGINKTINIIGSLTDDQGNGISGELVTLWVNGQNYTSFYTDTNGKAYFDYKFVTDGDYTFQISFIGGNGYNASNSTVKNFTITTPTPPVPPIPIPSKNTSYINLSLNVKNGYGYVVGETAIVSWITQGISNLNQMAIIQFVENGKIWHTAYVLLSDGQYQHQFIMSHKTLDIVMTFLGDQDTYPCFNKVSTFVDPVNNRRTFTEIAKMNKLIVAKKGNIDIIVRDYQGNPIKSGKVSLIFDNKWSFSVDILDGIAKFSKTMLKAGDNRSLEIKYIASGDNSASKLNKNVIVDKGTPNISLTAKPNTTVVKDKVSLTTSISGVIFSSQKKWYNTIKFYNNNQLQYQVKIPIKVNSYSTGSSTLDYTFKKSHDNMTISSIFNGKPNYYVVSDSVSMIVYKT